MICDVEYGPGWMMYYGDYRTVLPSSVVPDALITDPPYSATTHAGATVTEARDKYDRRSLSYASWGPVEVGTLAGGLAAKTKGWVCVMSCDRLLPLWRDALDGPSRYSFADVPCVLRGMTVRMGGDGPSSWTVHLTASRPRTKEMAKWGTLPGAYVGTPHCEDAQHIGGKPLWLMRAIVRDYSRRGDLVVDPCAGYGSTLVAALREGREAIGVEADRETYEIAVRRLRRKYTSSFDFGDAR